jgi:predicted metal-dependent HD superfamily phosphohydrolase
MSPSRPTAAPTPREPGPPATPSAPPGDDAGAAADLERLAAERWRETWQLLRLPAPTAPLAEALARHREAHRAYHDLRHVMECLGHAAAVRSLLAHPACVELALWFHDSMYDPRAGDNEARSAELAGRLLSGLTPDEVVAHARELILATRHPSRPQAADARFVVDIDLSILGSAPESFVAYERAIRREYRWVPAPLYRRERRRVLRSLLDLRPI